MHFLLRGEISMENFLILAVFLSSRRAGLLR